MTSTDRRITEETVRRSEHTDTGMVGRLLGVLAGAVAALIGMIAVVQIDWFDQGMDAPAVDVAGIAFTPWVAIGTVVMGLVAILAGASSDRASKLVVGAILTCVGIAILIPDARPDELELESGHGWLSLGVGVVLILSSLLMRRSATRTTAYRGDHFA